MRNPTLHVLFILAAALALATPLQAAPETGWETLLLPTTATVPGEGRVRFATLGAGSDFGLIRGQRGKFWSRRDAERDLDFAERGWAEIVSVDEATAEIRISLDDPAMVIRTGDLAGFPCRVPRLPWRSPLWTLAKKSILLTDLERELFVTTEELMEGDSEVFYRTLLSRMRADIASAAPFAGDLAAPKTGRFGGREMAEILANVTDADLEAFFDFLETFPGKYIGFRWKVAEVFATWVLNQAPPGAFAFAEAVLGAGSDAERAQRIEALAKRLEDGSADIKPDSLMNGWRERATDRSEEGRTDDALALSDLAVALAGRLDLPREQLWSLFRKAYVLSDAGRNAESRAIYLDGYAAFGRIDDPTAEDIRLGSFCVNNAAAQARTMGRYADALESFRAAREWYDRGKVARFYLGRNHRATGDTLLDMGRAEEAVAEFEAAAAIFREIEDFGPLQVALSRLADAHAKLGRTAEATAALEQILAAQRQAGSRRGEAEALRNLAEHHAKLGENRRARFLFEASLVAFRSIPDQEEEADVQQKLGRILITLGDRDAGIAALEDALAIRRSQQDTTGEASALLELGRIHIAAGEFGRGLDALEQARALYAREGSTAGERSVAEEMVSLLWEKFEYQQALALQDRLVALCEQDGAGEDLAYAILNRGALLDNLRDLPRSRQDLDDALARFRRMKSPYGEAQTLVVLARQEQNRQQWSSARALLDQALAIFGELQDRDRVADVTRNIGLLAMAQYHFDEAAGWLDRALALYADPEVGNLAEQANLLNSIAWMQSMRGDFTTAIHTYRNARTTAEQSGARPVVLTAVSGIADALTNLGRLTEAKAAYDRALVITEEVGNDWARAGTWWDLASFYDRLGETGESLKCNDRALEIWRRLKNEWGEAAILNNRAGTWLARGDVERGLADLRAGLPIVTRTGDQQLLAAYHGSMARAHFLNEDYESALAESEISLRYSREIESHRFIVEQLGSLAAAHLKLAENGVDPEAHLDTAGPLLAEALERSRATGAKLEVATTLVQQGRMELLRGRPDLAVATLLEARDLVTDSGARELTARVLFETSRALEAAGRLPEALAARREAVAAYEGMRAVLGGGEGSEEKFLRSKIEVYESMVSLLGRMVNAEQDPERRRARIDEALDFVGRVRFEVLKKGAAEIEGTGSAKVDEVLGKIRGAQKELTRLAREQSTALAAGNPERAAKIGEVIAQTEEELGRLYLDVKSADPDLDARLGFFDPREIDLMDAPEDTRLVVYFVGEEKLFLWVFSPEGFLEWKEYPLGREALNALIDTFRERIEEMIDKVGRREPMGTGFGPAAEANERNPEWYRENIRALREVLTELHQHLIGPIAEHVAAADPLLILPYGRLNYLPFDALIDPEGAFLGAKKRTVYFANEKNMSKTLARLAVPVKRGVDHWVAYADPRGKLISSLEEAYVIREFFENPLVLTEENGLATEAKLLSIPADCTILHFATHGFLNGRPSQTFLELAEPAEPSGTENDGRLTAGEIWPRLKKTVPCFRNRSLRLVVLSACDTARAQKDPQSEVLGMPGVFVAAGSPAVIASLWSVYSWTTTDLMVEFYRHVAKDRMDLATALRDARHTLITKKNGLYAHPFYWSPFLLFGDWR